MHPRDLLRLPKRRFRRLFFHIAKPDHQAEVGLQFLQRPVGDSDMVQVLIDMEATFALCNVGRNRRCGLLGL